MRRQIFQVLVSVSLLMCIPSYAEESKLLSMVSPKLRQFLTTHPGTLAVFTNTLSEAFSRRAVQVYYFYSDNDSEPRTYHYYPSESVVGICVRENQQPLDEFLCLVFESLNSESEKAFRDLYRRAESGGITRTGFAQEMLKVEFNAAKRMRDLVRRLKLNEKEVSESYYYTRFSGCPDGFDDFLSYIAKVSPARDAIKGYEGRYDSLRKH